MTESTFTESKGNRIIRRGNGVSRSSYRTGSPAGQGGFTLIEIMVVVVIIGLLATMVLPRVLGRLDQSQQIAVKADINQLSTALKFYKLDNAKFPSSSDGLSALISGGRDGKGYLDGDSLPKDPWGNDYLYQYPGQHLEFDIWSLGADGQAGGTEVNADIGNWNMDEVK